LIIRRMRADELERIRDIDRSETIRIGHRQEGREIVAFDVNWDDGGWLEGDGEHSFGRMIRGARRQLDLGGTAFGAFDGNRLAGIAIYRPRLTERMAQLALLHVSDGYRRQGIASRLLDEVLSLARRDGAARLYVSSTPTESAVGFYRSKGFAPTDEPDPDLLAEEPDDIHMILTL